MCYFDADEKRYYPFGQGSGAQARQIRIDCIILAHFSRVAIEFFNGAATLSGCAAVWNT